jgi:TolA-binding protein
MRRNAKTLVALAVVATLSACASSKRSGATPDNEPTLKALAGREVKVEKDAGIPPSIDKAIAAYRDFLAVAPKAEQRAEAMRRLGDLEMDNADQRIADGKAAGGTPEDYRAAVQRYQEFLTAYPKDPGNDRVLYQLARAQEQGGELEAALKTLDRLVADYPATRFLEEAQFRRGEMLFSMRNYAGAEQAFGIVLKKTEANPYLDRALYMHGWSNFKQAKLEDALKSFFGVLDLKIANRGGEEDLDTVEGLTRVERELVEDTFRVVSLSLQSLQGFESIPAYITTDARKSYEFRVYQQLGQLYIKQERIKDAADSYAAFAKRQPLHPQAPLLQARVIDIYQDGGFTQLAIDAKKEYVGNYGLNSEFRKTNPEGWERAQPLVKTHLSELARHHHATAQQTKSSADYQEAVKWYRAYLTSFPTDPQAAQSNFLLAELLYEDKRYVEAAVEYTKTAYEYPTHEKAADAGYSAILSHEQQRKGASGNEAAAMQRALVESELRFADTFSADPRVGPVLTNAAEQLYALGEGERASGVAERVLKIEPAAKPEHRRVAWTVVAHTAFERKDYLRAEKAYGEVLALMPPAVAVPVAAAVPAPTTGRGRGRAAPPAASAPQLSAEAVANNKARAEFTERLAASVYKQGEAAKASGDLRAAVGHFERVATLAPTSPIRINAQYDAAAALIGLKDWDGAIQSLEDFRKQYPQHPLAAEVGPKLAVAFIEKQQWAQAATELERISATSSDAKLARDALWQAAELYEKGGSRTNAARAYERFAKAYPQPLELSLEARWRLAGIAKAEGNATRESALMREIYEADRAGGAARTDRTRTLGALGALHAAKPVFEAYQKIALVEPLQKQLKLKKAKMEEVLRAYAAASEYGVAEATTAATFHTAALYQDFGKALMTSQRPKKLSKVELEQYNVMLEEQAYPFEEKAIELYEVNVRRTAQGIYDTWVKNSYTALRQLRPVRYGKSERSEGVIDAIR